MVERVVIAHSIGEVRRSLKLRFGEKDGGVAYSDCLCLLGHLLDRTTSNLLIEHDAHISADQFECFSGWLERYENGEPVAYIVGNTEFMGLQFAIDSSVLVPRSDTECLVEFMIASIRDRLSKFDETCHTPIRVLDLGTGSGAIVVSIYHHLSQHNLISAVEFYASDTSQNALNLAQRNGLQYEAPIHWINSDWFFDVDPSLRFDFMMTNPPYVAENDPHLYALRYEPLVALVSDNHGMGDIDRIIAQSRSYCRVGSQLVIEHGHQMSESVKKSLSSGGFSNVSCHPDNAGRLRFSSAFYLGNV